MPEGAQASRPETQTGHRVDPDHVVRSRHDGAPTAHSVDADEVLSRARALAESFTARAHTHAEDLLSRARCQAELLRAQADAVRAEAESLRAEAGALRTTVRDEIDSAASHAASTAQMEAAARELLLAVHGEVNAARGELERMRTETLSILQVLRADVDTGLAGVQYIGADVRRLSATTDKLESDLRLLIARAAAGGTFEGVRGRSAGEPPRADAPTPPGVPWDGAPPEPPPAPHKEDVTEMLRQIWIAASSDSGGDSEWRSRTDPATATLDDARPRPAQEWVQAPGPGWDAECADGREATAETAQGQQPLHRQPDRSRAAEPLIGSGGWHANGAARPYADSPSDEAATPPPPPDRGRRRFPPG